jgi:branched-chain amino acid transport system ATP-binding protein
MLSSPRSSADPKLILIDVLFVDWFVATTVQEVFAILKSLRDKGATILLIEQNAKQLQISDYGLVRGAG